MKKNMKKAQMGGSYAQRRAYKSAGASKSKTASGEKSVTKGVGNINDSMERLKGKSFGPAKSSGSKGPVKSGGKSAASVTQQKSNDAYYSKLAGSSDKKDSASKPAKRKLVRTAAATISAPKREMPSTAVTAPKASGIQSRPEGRKYSEKEIKIMEAMKKGKKADGTMKTSAQRKIQRIRRSK